jgi:serine/threonine protein kinase
MADLIKQRYQLLDKLGQGGFGAVYKAFDQVLSRDVAIKLLNIANENQEEMVQRFQVESRVASRLEHQNILRVYDFGRDDNGRCYLVSELLKGDSLHAAMKGKKPLQLSMALDILYQVGSALEAAHEQNTVHRDIKPPNIFLNQPMRGASFVKLLDFGIAKVIGGNESLTVTGQIMGTPHYMSPEQIVNIKLVDHRSDIYSLGIVFYQMLTGLVPFDDESYFTIMKRQMQSPMPKLELPQYPAELTERLNKIVKIMTRKDVRKRVNHINEILYKVQQVWAAFPSLIQPRTTGVFQSVTAEIPHGPLGSQKPPIRGSIEEMLEPFQGADEIVDQLFISEGGYKEESNSDQKPEKVRSEDSLKDELAAPTQSSDENQLFLIEQAEREKKATESGRDDQSADAVASNAVASNISPLPLPPQPYKSKSDVEHLHTIAPPITGDDLEVATTPPQVLVQSQVAHQRSSRSPQASHPHLMVTPEQAHLIKSTEIAVEETPIEPTLSASIIDYAPIAELSTISSNEMDTVMERPSSMHDHRGSILLNRLILLTLLLVAMLLWRSKFNDDEHLEADRGLQMAVVDTTSRSGSNLSAQVETRGQDLVNSDGAQVIPLGEAHHRGSSAATVQNDKSHEHTESMSAPHKTSSSSVGAQARSAEVVSPDQGVQRESDQGVTSPHKTTLSDQQKPALKAGPQDPTKTTRKQATQSAKSPKTTKTSKPSKSSKRKRKSSRKKKVKKKKPKTNTKLRGSIKLYPDDLTYEVGQRVRLKLPSSAPKSGASFILGKCARWVNRVKKTIVFKKESTQCVIKVCYRKPKGCIKSRAVEVTGKLF